MSHKLIGRSAKRQDAPEALMGKAGLVYGGDSLATRGDSAVGRKGS